MIENRRRLPALHLANDSSQAFELIFIEEIVLVEEVYPGSDVQLAMEIFRQVSLRES